MRSSLLPVLALTMLVASCAGASDEVAAPAPSTVAAPEPPVTTAPEVAPGAQDPCPYLDTQWVSNTNGQRTLSQGVDTRFEEPACVFYSYGEGPHVQVLVRKLATEEQARAVVDWAAPVDSTSPAEFGEWQGGRGALPEGGSVYAVSRAADAVIVWSDQAQSIKAEKIAQEAIANLGL